MINRETQEKAARVLGAHPEVKLAYLFGSRAAGEDGPLSDYDFAVYLDGIPKARMGTLRLTLIEELSRAFATDKVDVVLLNTAASPELKYAIVRDGELIFEREPYRVRVEPRILNEYFDFYALLKRHKLSRAA
jgi:predicted nucleotidyltransferase